MCFEDTVLLAMSRNLKIYINHHTNFVNRDFLFHFTNRNFKFTSLFFVGAMRLGVQHLVKNMTHIQ